MTEADFLPRIDTDEHRCKQPRRRDGAKIDAKNFLPRRTQRNAENVAWAPRPCFIRGITGGGYRATFSANLCVLCGESVPYGRKNP
jgi:hypothetical protein